MLKPSSFNILPEYTILRPAPFPRFAHLTKHMAKVQLTHYFPALERYEITHSGSELLGNTG